MVAELADLPVAASPAVSEVTAAAHFGHLDADEAHLLAAAGPPLRHYTIGGSAGMTAFAWEEVVLVEHLRVDRACRRRGLATQLMKHALAVARNGGCTHAVLAPTRATVPFYERLGFRLERSRPDHWYYLPESL
jgi:GNAT superfamily N-acetyltransferase